MGDSMRTMWESHMASIQENIDRYISAHYQPPYVEHDLELEDEYRDDDFAADQSIGAAPQPDAFIGSCRFRAEDGDSSSEYHEIDDFLKQQGETISQMLLRLIDERNLKDSEVYKNANIVLGRYGECVLTR